MTPKFAIQRAKCTDGCCRLRLIRWRVPFAKLYLLEHSDILCDFINAKVVPDLIANNALIRYIYLGTLSTSK